MTVFLSRKDTLVTLDGRDLWVERTYSGVWYLLFGVRGVGPLLEVCQGKEEDCQLVLERIGRAIASREGATMCINMDQIISGVMRS